MAEGGWLEEQWALVYDIHFVQTNLIGNMKKVGEQVGRLLSELDHILKVKSRLRFGFTLEHEKKLQKK